MADFPPNLDDGELCLPSDIRREISSNQPKQAFINNIAMHHAPQIRDSFLGTMPNGHRAIVSGPPNVNPFAFWNSGFQAVPRQLPMYNPMTPPQVPVQGFDMRAARVFPAHLQNCARPVQVTAGGKATGFGWKCGGTGVFLPRVARCVLESEEAKGTGFFLGPLVAPTTFGKKKKSGKNRYRGFVSKGEAQKQEESQLPPEICLPKDWTY